MNIVVVGVLSATHAAFAQCAKYSVDIYTGPQGCQILPSWAGAHGINDAGDLCGGYNICGGADGQNVIWSPTGEITGLPPAADGGIPDSPFDINVSRDVVGRMYVPGLTTDRAFRYSDGITINLGTLPGGTHTEAYAISEDGKICGYSNTNTGPQAFTWQDGTMSAMALPLGPSSVAYDISDSGMYVCGWMGEYPSTHFGGSHAFILANGVVVDLGTPDPENAATEARAVNNLGEACGWVNHAYEKWPTGYTHGFFWSKGTMQELQPLPGYAHCLALDLNDAAQVIGFSQDDNAVGEPFIWQNGVMVALDDLIAPELNLDHLYVWSINNAGQVAGQANRPTPLAGDETVAVRLTPIQPPPGDCDCNGRIDMDDLLGVINQWGPVIPTTTADFNTDGSVGIDDLLEVLRRWSA